MWSGAQLLVLHLWSYICEVSPPHLFHSVRGCLMHIELGCMVLSFKEKVQLLFFFPKYHLKNILPGIK